MDERKRVTTLQRVFKGLPVCTMIWDQKCDECPYKNSKQYGKTCKDLLIADSWQVCQKMHKEIRILRESVGSERQAQVYIKQEPYIAGGTVTHPVEECSLCLNRVETDDVYCRCCGAKLERKNNE